MKDAPYESSSSFAPRVQFVRAVSFQFVRAVSFQFVRAASFQFVRAASFQFVHAASFQFVRAASFPVRLRRDWGRVILPRIMTVRSFVRSFGEVTWLRSGKQGRVLIANCSITRKSTILAISVCQRTSKASSPIIIIIEIQRELIPRIFKTHDGLRGGGLTEEPVSPGPDPRRVSAALSDQTAIHHESHQNH